MNCHIENCWREAIALANTTPGDDTITFGGVFTDGDTTNDTITLTSGELNLASNIIIDGSGGDPVTLSGNNSSRVFQVTAGVTAILDTLTISNGQADYGGGIRNDGTLALNNSTLNGNTATNFGGGIRNNGMLTVNNSTLSGNTATKSGGGIDNQNTLTISNSTFSNNRATQYDGGGIYSWGATLTVNNSTFSSNAATSYGSGIYVYGGTITATDNLFADNNVFNFTPDATNLVGTAASLGLDPVLRDNGGPTQTHALLPGSSAINAATGGTTTDQRGVAVYGTRDIGAYEYNPFVVTNTNDSGVGSLRWAIANANATPGDDTITFGGVFTDGDTTNDTITLTSGELNLASNIIIDGSGGDPVTLSGNHASRVVYIDSGATVALQSLTIANGTAQDNGGTGWGSTVGGGVINWGILSLEGMTLSSNTADYGGGLYNRGDITTLSNSTFSGNSSTSIGGGIRNDGEITSISNTTFSGNSSTSIGGGISNDGEITSLTNSTFSTNSAQEGGGILNSREITSISNSTFSGNSASRGGAISNWAGITSLTNNTFSNNSVQEGGGIFVDDLLFDGGTQSITNNLFADSPVFLFGEPLDATNLVGTAASLGLDPVLRDNGGPTQTHALLPYSPAIDAAMNGTTTDQRGVAAYGTRDVGAYEVQNDAPTSANASATLDEDTTHVFQASNFTFNDSDGGSLLDLKITSLPSAGQLFLDGNSNGTQDTDEAIALNQMIALADLSKLSFRPAANANGAAYATFGFQVGDGTSLSLSPYTMTLDVAPVNDDPSGTVTITGTATQGQTLTASNDLTDVDGISGTITYQWQADGSDITGATGDTLLLTQAQVGKAITVKASYTDDGGKLETVPSAATAAVANINDDPTGTVTITGTPTQGETLTASNTLADLDGIPPGAITYQWQAGGVDITGATGTTLLLTQAQVGKAITVKASYIDGDKTPEAVVSLPTSPVTALTPPGPTVPGSTPPAAANPPQITPLPNQLLAVTGDSPTRLTVNVTTQGAASVLDIAVVVVDDAEGRINGLLPSDSGYATAAIVRATTFLSVLKDNDFEGQFGRRSLPVAPGQFLQLALVQGGTLDDLKRGGAGQLFLATGAANANGQSIVQYSALSQGYAAAFTLPGQNTPSVTVQLGLDSAPAPVGSQAQGLTTQSELLDLTGMAGPTATLSFEVFREASFNNIVGLYTVQNAQGQVRDPLTGNLVTPGEAGYLQAALANRVVSNLAGQNGRTVTYTAEVATGQLLSTFLVVNGTLDALLDSTPTNDPTVFFNRIAANGDGQDHVRLLGDNTFGFEDIFGGGDQDFNDVIVKVAIA